MLFLGMEGNKYSRRGFEVSQGAVGGTGETEAWSELNEAEFTPKEVISVLFVGEE